MEDKIPTIPGEATASTSESSGMNKNIVLTNFEQAELARKYCFEDEDGDIFGLTGPEDFFGMNIHATADKRTKFLPLIGGFKHPEGEEIYRVTLVVQDNKTSWLNVAPSVKKGEEPVRDEEGYIINSENIYSEEGTQFVLANIVSNTTSPERIQEEMSFLSSLK